MWKCSTLFSQISILFYSDTFKHTSGWIQLIFPEITLIVVVCVHVFQRQLKSSPNCGPLCLCLCVLGFPRRNKPMERKKEKLDEEDENNLPPMGSESVFQNTRFSSRSPCFFSLCRRPGGQRLPVEGNQPLFEGKRTNCNYSFQISSCATIMQNTSLIIKITDFNLESFFLSVRPVFYWLCAGFVSAAVLGLASGVSFSVKLSSSSFSSSFSSIVWLTHNVQVLKSPLSVCWGPAQGGEPSQTQTESEGTVLFCRPLRSDASLNTSLSSSTATFTNC